MSFDLGNLLQNQVGGVLSQFLTANGENAENSSKAAGLAVPALVAGLVKHVSGGAGNASSLVDLISGAGGQNLSDTVAQAANGNVGGLTELGNKLLPQFLGGNAASVSDQIAQESGVSKAAAGSTLSLGLPLVLSALRGKAQSDNLGGSQILGLLGQQQGWLSSALSSNMLSALGIGSLGGLFGGLGNIVSGFGAAGATTAAAGVAAVGGTAVAAKSGGGTGKWIVLGIALLAALFAFKSCSDKKGAAPSESAASAASAASGASGTSDNAMLTDVPASGASAAALPASAPADSSASSASAASQAAAASAPADASAPAAQNSANARVVYENGVAKFYFATGKNDIADGAESIVADVITAGKEGKKLVISGFTDSTGNAKSNEALSKKRAQAVKAFFEAQGVKAESIELRKPETSVGAQGNDAEGRRVEVKVEG